MSKPVTPSASCAFVPPTPGYAPCTRRAGHPGPCAHPLTVDPAREPAGPIRLVPDGDPRPLTLRNDLQTREITTRCLRLRAATLDEANRSVEVTMTTDAPVTVFDWERGIIDEVLVADGGIFPDQLPFLSNHSRWSLDDVLGSVRGIRQEGGTWIGRAFFAEGDEDSDKAWNKTRQGHITDVSVGYRAIEFTDISPGQSQDVNGRSYTAGKRGLRVTTRWEAKELSLVPIGADRQTKVREQPGRGPGTSPAKPGQPPARPGKENRMNPQLRKFLESLGLRTDATEQQAKMFLRTLGKKVRTRADKVEAGTLTVEAARAEMDASVDEAPEPNESSVDEDPDPALADDEEEDPPAEPRSDRRPQSQRGQPTLRRPAAAQTPEQVRAAERDRQTRIRGLAGSDTPANLVTRALDEGWSVGRASRAFLENLRGVRSGAVGADAPNGIVRQRERDCTRQTMGLALVMRSMQGLGTGRTDAALQATARRLGIREDWANVAQRADQYRDMSLLDVVREALRLDGRDVPHTRDEQIRAAVSGGSLSNIFTTSVNAIIMVEFEEAEDTTVGWVAEADLPDFKVNEEIDVTRNSRLERLGRGGTAKDADAGDTEETWRLARYAKKFSVDEQDIIDDSMGVLVEMPKAIGMSARQLRPDLVYALLLSNPTLNATGGALFNATAVTTAGGHANLGSGAGSALSSSSLKTGITAMGKQTKGAGKNVRQLNIKARYLIVPQDLRFTGAELISSAQILKATGSDTTLEFGRNVIVDEQLELRSDNRLGAGGVLDPTNDTVRTGTATNWLLTSAPGRTIKVGYRRGTGRAPQIRPYILDKGQWGIGWDCNHDIGAVVQDFRGFYKSPGA